MGFLIFSCFDVVFVHSFVLFCFSFLVVVHIFSQNACVRVLIARGGPSAHRNTAEDGLLAVMFLPVAQPSEMSPMTVHYPPSSSAQILGLACQRVTHCDHSLPELPISIHTTPLLMVLGFYLVKMFLKNYFRTIFKKKCLQHKNVCILTRYLW